MYFFNWLKSQLKQIINSNQDQDARLLFPYFSEKKKSAKSLDERCNTARKYAIKNYLNKSYHTESNHEKLKPFFEKNETLHWIGIVSDIVLPDKYCLSPRILIDKLTLYDEKEPKLLDYHIWIRADQIKYVHNKLNQQTLAVGDAIEGISIINPYYGNKKEVKFGFCSTIILNCGVFIGQRRKNRQPTFLNGKIENDYNRHQDWILKSINDSYLAAPKYLKLSADDIFHLSGHTTFVFQSNQYSHFYKRLEKEEETKDEEAAHQIGPLTEYKAKVKNITYITEKNGGYQPVVVFNEFNKEGIKRSYFSYNQKLIALGELKVGDQITFSTKNILPNKILELGQIEKCSFVDKHSDRHPMPQNENQLLGYIMISKNDHQPEHLSYREAYQDWASKNHIQTASNSSSLFTKNELQQMLQIRPETLEKNLKRLFILPKKTINGTAYFDNEAYKKIESNLKVSRMLYKSKEDRPLIIFLKPLLLQSMKTKISSLLIMGFFTPKHFLVFQVM